MEIVFSRKHGEVMSVVVKDLLVNFLFVLLPLFIVQMFYLLKYTKQLEHLKDWIVMIFPVLSMVLCMAFPAHIYEGFVIDFRRIPFILGILYGGYRFGFFLMALMLVIRSFSGGSGFHVALIIYPLLTILLSVLAKHYLQMAVKQRILLNVVLIPLLEAIFFIMVTKLLNINVPVYIQLSIVAINMGAMLIVMILWESVRKILDLLQALVKAEKLEVVSHLAASISHEVRNPLTVSRGFMQLLHEDIPANKRTDYLNIAVRELDRAVEIISDYLTYAKPEAKGSEQIDVYKEIHHAVKVITPLANMNTVQIDLQKLNHENVCVLGERKLFEQCLMNIFKNGVEAMPHGGTLEISLVYYYSTIQINIRDTGEGMTEKQIQRLGEPYFTTKEKGTGLGMMVSFNIINRMNGKMSVSSEQGKGTCFSIELPVVYK